MTRAFLWIHLVLATLVVVGIFVQVYLIASYFFVAIVTTSSAAG